MANDLNQCNFIGRLGKDPEVKYMPSGKAVANISIAVGKSWKDKDSGEKKESTEWVPVVAFGRLAEIIGEYLTKGSQVFISGSFQTRKWQDKSENDRYTTEIIASELQMLGSNQTRREDRAPAQGQRAPDVDFDEDSDFPF